MAFCPNCGSHVEGKFCAKCGATVTAAPGGPAPSGPGAYQTGPGAPPQAPYSTAPPAPPPPAYGAPPAYGTGPGAAPPQYSAPPAYGAPAPPQQAYAPPPPAYGTGPGPSQPPAYGAPPPAPQPSYSAPPPAYQSGPAPPSYQAQQGYQAPPAYQSGQAPPPYQQGPQQPYGGGYAPPGQPAAGMQENVASCLCYVLGWITGIIFLVMEPYKNNRNIKFHAWQSIIFFGLVTVIQIFLSQILWHLLPISMWELWYWTIRIFSLLILVSWIFLMIQAYNRKKFVIPIIGGIAEQQANK